MSFLIHGATLEGNQRSSIALYPSSVDYDAFVHLSNIKKNIKGFVESGKNLLIHSKNTGNGKTSWSIKLLLSWFDCVWPYTDFECRGLFISMPKFIQAMKENMSSPNEYYAYVHDNIVKADLVVWDEINYKDWTPFEQEYMLSVLEQRLAIGKSNIYTTNYDLPSVEKKLGSRLSSRIIGCSDVVEFFGSDKRGYKIGGVNK